MSKKVVEVRQPVKVLMYRCDSCGKEAEATPYSTAGLVASTSYSDGPREPDGLPPKGWISVEQDRKAWSITDREFCSWACVAAFASRNPVTGDVR